MLGVGHRGRRPQPQPDRRLHEQRQRRDGHRRLYTYGGDANHTGDSGSATFTIDKASSTVTVSCPANVTYSPKRWRDGQQPFIQNFKATPLMVGGRLYLNTPLSIGAAIDAKTGETLWVYNPKSYEAGTTTMSARWNQRGVAYWSDGKEERVFWGTGDGYLVALDAKTGEPVDELRRSRARRSDAGLAARRARLARLAQRAHLFRPVAARSSSATRS